MSDLVERLREVPRGLGHSLASLGRNGVPARQVIPYGNMLNEAADRIEELERQVEEARAAEREACARIVEETPLETYCTSSHFAQRDHHRATLAKAIRDQSARRDGREVTNDSEGVRD